MEEYYISNKNFIKSKKSQMHVVMAILLIAILLLTVVFFWRTSQEFSQSYSRVIDEKSFQNIASYIENIVAHNEIAWIERTMVQTNMVITLSNDDNGYAGENEFFRIEYGDINRIKVYVKDMDHNILNNNDGVEVYLGTRFYVNGKYDILYETTNEQNNGIGNLLKDENIIGDFFLHRIEPILAGRDTKYIVYLTPAFKSAVIGDAGQPPESLAKTCYLLEYPKGHWSDYYDGVNNEYSVNPSNYYIVNSKDHGIDRRYVNYYTNIFIPSNSDMIDSLSEWKDVISDYIKNGGSLIMLSQNPSSKTKYDFLPVNVIFDKGEYDTIGVSKQHNITLNIDPYEIAGSYFSAQGTILEPFFDGPTNEVLLREIPYGSHLNSNPALIVSTWGAGNIVTTTIPIDKKAVVDTKMNVCTWWSPGELGNLPDWHFRRLVIVDSGDSTRVNEPIEVIIDPTAEINKLAKDGLINLEDASLDLNSIRVVEVLGPDYCSIKVEIPSQSYMYRPNIAHPRYYASPIETLEHPLFFELEEAVSIKVIMTVPEGSSCKDSASLRNEIRVKVNDKWVTHPIDFQTTYETSDNRPDPGYWNPQDGDGGAEGWPGPRSYEIIIPAQYFHRGDNKIILSMAHRPRNENTFTWYRNVEFSLQYLNPRTSQYELFWKQYQPMHVYFTMGATAHHPGETPGTSNSVTPPNTKRYYEIYFDIENQGLNKPVPIYRTEDNSIDLTWTAHVDTNPTFPTISGIPSIAYPHIRNISSPSTKDVNKDGYIDVVIGLRDGNVALIDGPTGDTLWRKSFDNARNPTSQGHTYTVYGLSVVGSPAVVDLDKDDNQEIIGGSVNFIASIDSQQNRKTVELSVGDTNITALDHNGNVKWKVPVSGSPFSAPAIADINNDGHLDIIVQTLEVSGISYSYRNDQVSFENNQLVQLTNHLYVISGDNQNILWHLTEDPRSYRMRFFATIESNKLHLMLPSSSPAVGDITGDGNLEIVTGNVDGYAYAYDRFGNRRWRSSIRADVGNNFSNLLGYIASSPTITRTDNQKDYDDAIMSFVMGGGNSLNVYVLDGITGSHTIYSDLTNQTARHPSGHPIVHWPEGYHHRGPQVTIPMNNYLCIGHLAQTHTVYGNITQAGTSNRTQSYATPAIVEANRYSTDLRMRETGRFDVILGAENGYLYCHAYTDTTSGVDEGNNETQISFGNRLKKLWEYSHGTGSPIRSSVAVDDITNDGNSEVIFIDDDGVLSAITMTDNFSSWNTERGNLHRTGDTTTKLDLPTYIMADLTETIDYGDYLDPKDDIFRLNANFTISNPQNNNFLAYVTNEWLKIDTNQNQDLSDELELYKNYLVKLNIKTNEGRNVEKVYQIESIFGDILNGKYMVTFLDRGMIRLFNNVMAYTAAPTKNIQIEEGIWVNLDLPDRVGTRDYTIQGLGDTLLIYDSNNPEVQFTKELRGMNMNIYGTISSTSKNKYVVITSYGAYLSPNPEGG